MIVKLPLMVLAFGIGLLLATQPVLNAEAARHIGGPLIAAAFSLIVSFVVVLPALGLGGAAPQWSGFAQMPWWAFLGRIAGACFVLGGLTIAPLTGVVVFVGCVLFGQIVGATLIDQFGAFKVAVRAITVERGVAIVLLATGLVMFLRGAR